MPRNRAVRSTHTPASPCEAAQVQPDELLANSTSSTLADESLNKPPPPAQILNVSRLLCPGCRHPLATYSTARRTAVIVRYHRCPHCGRTHIRTHEGTDGFIRFVGWAQSKKPQFSQP